VSFFSEERANELRAIFFESAQELLQALNEEGLRLEKAPADADIVRDIRRTVHTLKGDSAACGYRELSELAHALEDVLTPEIAGPLRRSPRRACAERSRCIRGIPLGLHERHAAAFGRRASRHDAARHPRRNERPRAARAGFEWNEYERLVIANSAGPAGGVLNVGLVLDPKCAMPEAALQVIWRVLRQTGTVLVARPEIDSTEPAAMVEAVLATEQSAEYVRRKCQVPGIVSTTYVEPYGPAALSRRSKAP
jgi:two-component system chemotaxis sensor kinase CheA